MKILLLAAAALAVLGFGAGPARATVETFDLNQGLGTDFSNVDYGTVTLNDNGGSTVLVTVHLNSGEGFINSGAGEALLWDMTPHPTQTITGLTTGFSILNNGTSTGNEDGSGSWYYAIHCNACDSGGSNPYTGDLSFTIDNVSLTNFTDNGKGFYFASDICTLVSGGSCTGKTGDVAANSFTTNTPVPEPASLALLGIGLAGLGMIRRYRRG